jgi:hypothetical protein
MQRMRAPDRVCLSFTSAGNRMLHLSSTGGSRSMTTWGPSTSANQLTHRSGKPGMATSVPPEFVSSPAARKLWKRLSSQQRRTVQRLHSALRMGSQSRLSSWHELGQLAATLTANPSDNYGQQLVAGLAGLSGWSPSAVHRARKFAGTYTAPEVEGLEGKLTWSRIAHLAAIADEDQRRKLQRECIANQWSVRELQFAIRGRLGRQRRRGLGGRPSHRPNSLLEALADLERLLSAVCHWHRGLEHAPAAEAGRTTKRRSRHAGKVPFDIGQFPPDLRSRLTGTIRSVEDLLIRVESARDVLAGRTDS